MAIKKKIITNEFSKDIPMTLDDHPFFGIIPDREQKELMDAVWKRDKKVFLVDSIAGSGKTLIATALGVLMVKYGIYDKIVYITFPGIYEKTQGFLPGDLLTKSEPYFQPLYDALLTIGELPDHVCNTSSAAIENGTSYIECAVSTYMRGININNAFVIIDEAENADLQTLTKVISRINDNSSVIIIGNMIQCDMYDKTKSGPRRAAPRPPPRPGRSPGRNRFPPCQHTLPFCAQRMHTARSRTAMLMPAVSM